MQDLTTVLQALVAASIFFVWVVRYANIIQEFKQYGLPDWLRDLVGVLKLAFALLLLLGMQRAFLAVIGSLGIAGLMGCAFAVHLRVRILPTRSSRFEPPNRSADAVVGQASRLSGEASIGCESSASLAAPPDRQDACPTTGFGGRNPAFKMLPSLTLLALSLIIAVINYRLLKG